MRIFQASSMGVLLTMVGFPPTPCFLALFLLVAALFCPVDMERDVFGVSLLTFTDGLHWNL